MKRGKLILAIMHAILTQVFKLKTLIVSCRLQFLDFTAPCFNNNDKLLFSGQAWEQQN